MRERKKGRKKQKRRRRKRKVEEGEFQRVSMKVKERRGRVGEREI